MIGPDITRKTSTLIPSVMGPTELLGLHYPKGQLLTKPSRGSACVCSPAPTTRFPVGLLGSEHWGDESVIVIAIYTDIMPLTCASRPF